MRCSSCSFLKYLFPKSLTTRVSWMGLHFCVQSLGTILFLVYSFFDIRLPSISFEISTAWGRPCMPFRISMYTMPSVVAFSFRLYSYMVSSGMLHNFSLRYSYCVR